MRGLTTLERRCLQNSTPESNYDLGDEDEWLCCGELVTRGLLRTWRDRHVDESGEEDDYIYFEITPLGRLALSVCLPESSTRVT